MLRPRPIRQEASTGLPGSPFIRPTSWWLSSRTAQGAVVTGDWSAGGQGRSVRSEGLEPPQTRLRRAVLYPLSYGRMGKTCFQVLPLLMACTVVFDTT